MKKNFKILILIILSFFTFYSLGIGEEKKIKIGLMVPITGDDKKLGQQIIKSVRIALKDIGTNEIEIFLKDTNSNPNKTIKSAIELKNMGVEIVIGPVFHKCLKYLDEVKEINFLSFTNKTIDLPSNVISAGINATSQLNAIKKFIELNNLDKTNINVPLIFSGGCGSIEDVTAVKEQLKDDAIAIASAFHYKKLTIKDVKKITNND